MSEWHRELRSEMKRLSGLSLLYPNSKLYECGVYTGESALQMAHEINRWTHKNIDFFLFDTYEGMPECGEFDNRHKKGDFNQTSKEIVKDKFKEFPFIKTVKGYIPDSFVGHEDDKILFAHVDVDIYKSYVDCLNFIFPRLVKSGTIYCHDYNYDSCLGAKKAIDEFTIAHSKELFVYENGDNYLSLVIEKL